LTIWEGVFHRTDYEETQVPVNLGDNTAGITAGPCRNDLPVTTRVGRVMT